MLLSANNEQTLRLLIRFNCLANAMIAEKGLAYLFLIFCQGFIFLLNWFSGYKILKIGQSGKYLQYIISPRLPPSEINPGLVIAHQIRRYIVTGIDIPT